MSTWSPSPPPTLLVYNQQLSKERERLHAMMAHLHLPPLGALSLAAPVGVLPPQPEASDDPFSPQVELGQGVQEFCLDN